MSQPFNRGCQLAAPGDVDEDLGEFWVGNPWFIPLKHNLSCYERNRCFLNVAGENFVDISHITGTDSDGDGRCVVGADLNNDGQNELLVRQAGGISFIVYENRFVPANWAKVSLRGMESNRLGIGSRLVAHVGDQQIVRELYPINSFNSQAPSLVHFGLGSASQIDRLEIHWPSGQVQQVESIAANQHVVISEGESEYTTAGGATAAP